MGKSKKIDAELMEMGEDMFWEEFNTGEGEYKERYYVVDVRGGNVVVANARLMRKKKKAEV